MFTGNEDMEATALREQGWSISAIARHLNRDRATIRNHLNGTRVAGKRKRSEPDPFEEFVPYLGERLREDPHVWATALFDEVVRLGSRSATRASPGVFADQALRPHCEACDGVKGRATIEIEHPPGEEIQWDWDELPDAPWGDDTHMLVGSLPCSGKFRGVFSESEDQAHLIEAIDGVLRRLGGNASTVARRPHGDGRRPDDRHGPAELRPRGQALRRRMVACPPRRGNRKGSVEKSIHFATERFWRTMTAETMAQGQEQLDRFCEPHRRPPSPAARQARGDRRQGRRRVRSSPARRRRRPTVADLAELERLRPLPAAPFPGHHRGSPTSSAPRPSSPSRATPTRSPPGSSAPR